MVDTMRPHAGCAGSLCRLFAAHGRTTQLAVNAASRATMAAVGMQHIRTVHIDWEAPLAGSRSGGSGKCEAWSNQAAQRARVANSESARVANSESSISVSGKAARTCNNSPPVPEKPQPSERLEA